MFKEQMVKACVVTHTNAVVEVFMSDLEEHKMGHDGLIYIRMPLPLYNIECMKVCLHTQEFCG